MKRGRVNPAPSPKHSPRMPPPQPCAMQPGTPPCGCSRVGKPRWHPPHRLQQMGCSAQARTTTSHLHSPGLPPAHTRTHTSCGVCADGVLLPPAQGTHSYPHRGHHRDSHRNHGRGGGGGAGAIGGAGSQVKGVKQVVWQLGEQRRGWRHVRLQAWRDRQKGRGKDALTRHRIVARPVVTAPPVPAKKVGAVEPTARRVCSPWANSTTTARA